MRAAVAYEPGQPLVVEDVPRPAIGPRDVLVKIAASGICHTDITVIDGLSGMPRPIVPGHESCGTVEEVGADVRRVKPGDRVLASVSPACGSCWWCINGMSNHCDVGVTGRTSPRIKLANGQTAVALCGCGTFADEMVVDEASVLAVQTELPDEELALLGCGVTTGVGAALNTAKITPGSSVAVIGCGGVGQSVVQGSRIAGASTIIAIDLAQGRRQAALGVGATHAIDPAQGDPVEQVRDLTGGRGADYTFEVVGDPQLVVQAFDMARTEGTVTAVGMPASDATITFPAMSLIFTGKQLRGSVMGGAQILRDFPRFIRFAETGQLQLGGMVSKRIALDQINEGIDALHRAEGIRTVIV
jgi:S-(hydroxymethyl)glutathione dehydrogenase/alcohol dehydrogenase